MPFHYYKLADTDPKFDVSSASLPVHFYTLADTEHESDIASPLFFRPMKRYKATKLTYILLQLGKRRI